LGDIRALLTPDRADALDAAAGRAAFVRVFGEMVTRLPGQRWARTDEVAQQLGLSEIVEGSA